MPAKKKKRSTKRTPTTTTTPTTKSAKAKADLSEVELRYDAKIKDVLRRCRTLETDIEGMAGVKLKIHDDSVQGLSRDAAEQPRRYGLVARLVARSKMLDSQAYNLRKETQGVAIEQTAADRECSINQAEKFCDSADILIAAREAEAKAGSLYAFALEVAEAYRQRSHALNGMNRTQEHVARTGA